MADDDDGGDSDVARSIEEKLMSIARGFARKVEIGRQAYGRSLCGGVVIRCRGRSGSSIVSYDQCYIVVHEVE